MADIFNMLDTWNAAGTTFTGIKLNVTDTASAAGSLLMDLQVGGVSQFSVAKGGLASATGYSGGTGGFSTVAFHGTVVSSANAAVRDGVGVVTRSANAYNWVSNTNAGSGTIDLSLFRDAANTLAQRNGVNAQAFNLYNTYTDASNYERGFMRWTSNLLRIGTDALGTGTARQIFVQSFGFTSLQIRQENSFVILRGASASDSGLFLTSEGYLRWAVGANAEGGSYDLGLKRSAAGVLAVTNGTTGTTGAVELGEMTAPAAPPTNSVRIYAEDNGSGKTRLMALFATGAAQQIALEP